MKIQIRQASVDDLPVVLLILHEAANWLKTRGMPLWLDCELLPEDIAQHIRQGRYFLAEQEEITAGTFRFELSDPDFWPEITKNDSAFIHRLAVRRAFAGGQVSAAMLAWAVDRTRSLGRQYLRLDCEATRPRLRAVYERFGFQYHSDQQVGPFHVARYELKIDAM